VRAAATAAAASTTPKPYLWEKFRPKALCHSGSGIVPPAAGKSFCRAVLARIRRTSRQVSSGLVASINATTPLTIGVLAEVPVKSERYRLRMAVVVMRVLVKPLLVSGGRFDDGAHTSMLAPRSP